MAELGFAQAVMPDRSTIERRQNASGGVGSTCLYPNSRVREATFSEATATVTIYAFGDDHARQAFGLCTNIRLRWLGPYTMRRVSQEGAFKTLEIGMPKAGDTMIYMVGAQDVRRHLFRFTPGEGADVTAAVTGLAERYLAAVHWLTTLLDFPMTICIVGVVAPAAPTWDDTARPAYGTFEQRRAAREALNAALRVRCAALGARFVEIPRLYETRSGALKPRLSDGRGHIAPDHAHPLCAAVERAIDKDLGFPRPELFSSLRRQYARARAIRTGDIESLQELGVVQPGQLQG